MKANSKVSSTHLWLLALMHLHILLHWDGLALEGIPSNKENVAKDEMSLARLTKDCDFCVALIPSLSLSSSSHLLTLKK